MANETEIERLVVRIAGDATSLLSTLSRARRRRPAGRPT